MAEIVGGVFHAEGDKRLVAPFAARKASGRQGASAQASAGREMAFYLALLGRYGEWR